MTMTVVISYTIFSIFVFYQQLHIKNFSGSNAALYTGLNIFAFAAMVAGICYLIYFGYKVSWFSMIGLFLISLLVRMLAGFVEQAIRISPEILSVAGFVAIPASGYFMVSELL